MPTAGPFGIPDGPCYTFRDPSGNELAIFGNERPDALEREYEATPERVFAAWADPAEKARWFGLSGDGEFELDPGTTRADVLSWWEDGWRRVFHAIEALGGTFTRPPEQGYGFMIAEFEDPEGNPVRLLQYTTMKTK